MNIALYYFSGTGNTKYACEKFKYYMEQKENSVILYNIEEIMNKNNGDISPIIDQADLVGFAYPVYGANLPKIMELFFNSFFSNSSKNRDAFIISTVGIINAYGPFIIKKRLKKLGLNLRWHYVYYTINNTAVRKKNNNQLEIKHKKNIVQFENFCNSIINNILYHNGIGPWLIGGFIVRTVLKRPIANHYITFFVDSSLCTKCNICINSCPTKSITYQNNHFTFSENCTTCLRCINNCPANAIMESHA